MYIKPQIEVVTIIAGETIASYSCAPDMDYFVDDTTSPLYCPNQNPAQHNDPPGDITCWVDHQR